MELRSNKFTGGEQKDIHEADSSFLKKSYDNACWVAENYNWVKIACTDNSVIRSIDEIHEDIYQSIKSKLA